MLRPNAFQPIWPPPIEVDFHALPEVRKARRLFRAQRTSLAGLAREALRLHPGADCRRYAHEMADLLHNIAGTAAYFGDSAFGDHASTIELQVRSASNSDLLQPLCHQMLARMQPEQG